MAKTDSVFKIFTPSEWAVAEIDMARIKDSVKWEVSRGGAKFPHQYGALTMDDILSQNVLTPNAEGRYEFDTK